MTNKDIYLSLNRQDETSVKKLLTINLKKNIHTIMTI